jgi:hypothetical protein
MASVLVILTLNPPTANGQYTGPPYSIPRRPPHNQQVDSATRECRSSSDSIALDLYLGGGVAALVVLDRFGGSSKLNAKARLRCNKVKTGPTVTRGLSLSLS